MGQQGLFPLPLGMRDPTGRDHQVQWPIAEHLIRDVQLATPRVSRLGTAVRHRGASCQTTTYSHAISGSNPATIRSARNSASRHALTAAVQPDPLALCPAASMHAHLGVARRGPNSTMTDCEVQDVDPQGQLVWSWDVDDKRFRSAPARPVNRGDAHSVASALPTDARVQLRRCLRARPRAHSHPVGVREHDTARRVRRSVVFGTAKNVGGTYGLGGAGRNPGGPRRPSIQPSMVSIRIRT